MHLANSYLVSPSAQVPQLFVNQLASSTLRWHAVGLRIDMAADLDGRGAAVQPLCRPRVANWKRVRLSYSVP